MDAIALERKLKELLDAAVDANRDFDVLYSRGQMRQNDFGKSLAANLDLLRDELDLLVKEAIYPGLLK